ncbi:uncharacterized protein LOC114263358 [Camellia sinensis]|uniref:uncharacterized protein LOC114263358 n=1 Tax=Camellia sinensis TaxID=4442 RepID=UPI001035EDBE|nr:uncharacterized protein LOC114263358 [Camellia sinensis]
MNGFYECMQRLVLDVTVQDLITNEMSIYMKAESLFGKSVAIRQRNTRAPADWWASYGSYTPNLQTFAIKVLSLTCSSSSCERNWSVFEHLHSKKRNILEQQRLNDLVYVKYNRTLRFRYDMRNTPDLISLQNIDESNEWLLGRMDGESDEDNEPVFDDDDGLTWATVARASGVEESSHASRATSSRSKAQPRISKSSTLTPLQLIDEEEAGSERRKVLRDTNQLMEKKMIVCLPLMLRMMID